MGENIPKCTKCNSSDIRIDNRDRPDYRLDGYCLSCKHEWTVETEKTKDLLESKAYIHCGQCDKLIEAKKTHNGICECWLGHCCGFGQVAVLGEEIY